VSVHDGTLRTPSPLRVRGIYAPGPQHHPGRDRYRRRRAGPDGHAPRAPPRRHHPRRRTPAGAGDHGPAARIPHPPGPVRPPHGRRPRGGPGILRSWPSRPGIGAGTVGAVLPPPASDTRRSSPVNARSSPWRRSPTRRPCTASSPTAPGWPTLSRWTPRLLSASPSEAESEHRARDAHMVLELRERGRQPAGHGDGSNVGAAVTPALIGTSTFLRFPTAALLGVYEKPRSWRSRQCGTRPARCILRRRLCRSS